jgi:hypothetical protein
MNLDLKELERKAFRSTFQDGLWDIYLGLLLLQMGLGPLAAETELPIPWIMVIALVFVAVVFAGFYLAKKHITLPRIGMVKFGPERQNKRKKVTLVLSFSVLVGLILAVLGSVVARESLDLFFPIWILPFGIFGINAVIVFSLGAYYLDYTRAYLYGWFFALAFPGDIMVVEQLDLTFPLVSVSLSAVMVTIGLVFFIRFLRETPKPIQEV